MPEDLIAELLGDFLLESEERVERVEELLLALARGDRLERSKATAELAEIARQLHTLKGNSGMMGFEELQRQAHELEDAVAALDPDAARGWNLEPLLDRLDGCRTLLATLKPAVAAAEPGAAEENGPATASEADRSVRVPLAGLDRLTTLMAELVSARHRMTSTLGSLAAVAEARGWGEAELEAWRRVERAHLDEEVVLDSVRAEVLGLGMIPFRRVFGRLRRLAHDEALHGGKEVEIETQGDDTPIDRSLVEVVGDVLGHLVRNAVVHGIEPPEERERAGKSARGTILIQASIRSEVMVVEVMDDGAGIEREALAAAARRVGLAPDEGADLTALLFLPGLTTREQVDVGAGRGVGLAVVRESVVRLGGDVEVASVPGVGTRFALRLPVSVSTLRAVLVRVDGEEYALPTATVVETVSAPERYGRRGGVWEWRGETRARLDLGKAIGTAAPGAERSFIVVLEVEGRTLGLSVDAVGEILDVVVKGIEPLAERSPVVGGATIVGDGRVVLILDPHGLAAARVAAPVAGAAGPGGESRSGAAGVEPA